MNLDVQCWLIEDPRGVPVRHILLAFTDVDDQVLRHLAEQLKSTGADPFIAVDVGQDRVSTL